MYRLILTVFCFVYFASSYGQGDVIKIKNGSFEDQPRQGDPRNPLPIKGWYDCGEDLFPGESPPDIHPIDYWQVTKQASKGATYLGLVVRDVETWESVSQRLEVPIEANKCYQFTVDLARSNMYVSLSRLTGRLENYTEPAVIRVWGGQRFCESKEFLGESPTISNYEWREYTIQFKPKKSHQFILVEAFYKTPALFPYNGHILVDDVSHIYRIACPGEDYVGVEPPVEEEPLVVPEIKKEPEVPNVTQPIVQEKPKEDNTVAAPIRQEEPVTRTVTKPKEVTPPAKPKVLVELDRKTIKMGQTIEIENLYFAEDSSQIQTSSYPILEEVYDFLDENQDVNIEIGGHTSSVRGITHAFCDGLSTDRAKAVAEYLVEKGINEEQLKYKGYGKRKPIASNLNKEGRRKNQRVEIKILNIE